GRACECGTWHRLPRGSRCRRRARPLGCVVQPRRVPPPHPGARLHTRAGRALVDRDPGSAAPAV
ncbi:MAG: hypothetical protein AVDCRST_MAG34-2983, partial [uncultured Nocardioidaceae bacterium]